MRAARITRPKHFEILDVEKPQLQDNQCMIKVEAWSACGSDIRGFYGPILPDQQYPLGIGLPCHECAGVIVESRSETFDEGQRVIVLPSLDGQGGLVEYLVAEPTRMVLLPEEGEISDWVICQPAGTAIYGCQKIGTLIGKRVMVIGQGSIGLSFTAICSRSGASQVIVSDVFDYRLEYSRTFGATNIVNTRRDDLYESVSEVTGGLMPDIVIEASGYSDALNDAFRLIKKDGIVLMFGMYSEYSPDNEYTTVQTSYIHEKTPVIIPVAASRGPDPISHIKAMIDLKLRGWWDPSEMITHRRKFDDVNEVYAMYEERADNIIKAVMTP